MLFNQLPVPLYNLCKLLNLNRAIWIFFLRKFIYSSFVFGTIWQKQTKTIQANCVYCTKACRFGFGLAPMIIMNLLQSNFKLIETSEWAALIISEQLAKFY